LKAQQFWIPNLEGGRGSHTGSAGREDSGVASADVAGFSMSLLSPAGVMLRGAVEVRPCAVGFSVDASLSVEVEDEGSSFKVGRTIGRVVRVVD
jgi:hypothetical protein